MTSKAMNGHGWMAVLAGLLVLGVAAGLSCGGGKQQAAGEGSVTKAVAVLNPTEGSKVHGVVTFTQDANGIRVVAAVDGLTPGKHGFHIHEFGDCTSPDGNSAGGHFNPHGALHAGPTEEKRHAGDLGNIEAGPNGAAKYDRVDAHLTFSGKDSIVGRSVIVHAQPDDLATQPTGGAGARLVCGVIGVAKP